MSQNKSESWGIICRFSWLDKNKKTTINPVNKNNSKCFQYAATHALNLEKTGKNSERITTIKPFIDKYNLNRPKIWLEKNWEK